MIWYILLAVAAVIGIIALIASTKPDEWSIQRQQIHGMVALGQARSHHEVDLWRTRVRHGR